MNNQMHRNFIHTLSFCFLWLVIVFTIQASGPGKDLKTKSVSLLTIGNSFAGNALKYLPQITKSVVGYEILITTANIGGCSLEKHVSLIRGCEKDSSLKPYSEKYCLNELLLMDNYDFITIQQASPLSFNAESFQPYADSLFEFIKKLSPESEVLIHQTWAYSPASKRLKELGLSRDEMHYRLLKNYNDLSEHLDLRILPSGNAFYRSYKRNPGVELWAEDGYHAGMNGCYLAGCIWFGRFFGVSPAKIRFIPEGMSPETAKFLRKIAVKEIRKIKKADPD